jgi:Fur family transcriptional regulator, zinc uptake regulator
VNVSKKADYILEKFGLKKTQLRRTILSIFLSSQKSFTQAELIEELESIDFAADRVSIYRNLSQLIELGAIHEVNANTYVCCNHDCAEHFHILLYCSVCRRHEEVTEHKMIHKLKSTLELLNFFGNTKPLFLKGTCLKCSSNELRAKLKNQLS